MLTLNGQLGVTLVEKMREVDLLRARVALLEKVLLDVRADLAVGGLLTSDETRRRIDAIDWALRGSTRVATPVPSTEHVQ